MPYKSSSVDPSKLTPWLEGVPQLPGLYERKFLNGVVLAYWDGNCWFLGAVTRCVNRALSYYRNGTVSLLSVAPHRKYRGLNFDPT